ncbi:MAG TPA: response regulator [Terriglobia bacterium]|nr:response regulator [Terriglobia bacterium]
MKILIADDDRVYVRLVAARLAAKGVEVFTAYDAMQAWMATTRLLPDAVILDINMPAGTGREFLKRIRMMGKTAHIRVIVVSGSINPYEKARVMSIGADEYLPKPLDFDQLFATLYRLLGIPLPENPRSETEQPAVSA